MGHTQKQIREKLDGLHRKPAAYLRSTESYDVSAKGETKKDWVEEAADFGEDMHVVEINLGGTGVYVVVMAGHPDEALETAYEWTVTKYYDGDSESLEGTGEGPVAVRDLMSTSNPRRRKASKSKATKKVAKATAKTTEKTKDIRRRLRSALR